MKRNRRGKECRYLFWKRVLDVFFSALLLIFLWIPMGVIAIAVGLTSRGGILFRQIRVGRNGDPFVCYKFRTMMAWAPRDCPTSELGDPSPYVTPIGRFLRRTSLDELPQLWNVLRGDMSLVGPRPLIPKEGEIHKLRHRCGVYAIRPGMTGLAQVSGRDFLDDREKLRRDARYLRQISLWEDVRILGKTLLQAFWGRDVVDRRD